ncbi:MAG: hypothetical protein IKO27_00025 [Ruminococcus sp.]|nr:hypothetical protein [Ruminococcus sp.]
MRKINDMLKLIPPDELNGGITMKGTNGTDDNKSNISCSNKKNTNEIRLRRGTSGIVAAALVLAIGGGALAIALNRKDSAKTSPASSVSAVSDDALAEADSNARKVYNLINANISAYIVSGKLKEVATGSFKTDLASPDSDSAKVLTRSTQDRFNDPDAEKYFTEIAGSIADIPETGEIFYVVNERFKPVFVQYRAYEGAAVGQFSSVTDGRTEFGKLPETADSTGENTAADVKTAEHAKAFYDIFNRMQDDYLNGEYPINQNWAMLPPGELVVLDLDKRDRYADLIWRMEGYNAENVEFTGKLFIEYALGNDPDFVAWQPAEGGLIEVWFCNDGATGFNPGDYPDNETAWNLKQGSGYSYDEADIGMIANEMGCKRCILGAGGLLQGRITERSNMPKVFEWYESFLAGNFEPVKFNAKKLISPEKLEKVVEYNWIDTEKKEPVIIRTSDIEGANIYVNGRYYNVEDTSVLTLLDDGMPLPVNNTPA